MCGALSRLSSGICANCKSVLTPTSSSTITGVLDRVPPAAVSEKFDYIGAEHVITKLNSVMSSMSEQVAVSPGAERPEDPFSNYCESEVKPEQSSFPSAETVAAAAVLSALPAAAAMAVESARRALDAKNESSSSSSSYAAESSSSSAAASSDPVARKPVGDFFTEARVPRARLVEESQEQSIIQEEISPVAHYSGSENRTAKFVEECKQAVERSMNDPAALTPANFELKSKPRRDRADSPKRSETASRQDAPQRESKVRSEDLDLIRSVRSNVSGKLGVKKEADGEWISPSSGPTFSRENVGSDHIILKLPKKAAVIGAFVIALLAYFLVNGLTPSAPGLSASSSLIEIDSTPEQKGEISKRRVVLPQANFLGEYKIRLTDYSGLLSDGIILIQSREGSNFKGEAVINHSQSRELVNNNNGTMRVNNAVSKQFYSISGSCANSNVLSMRLIPKQTNFRPMHLDAVAEYNGNRLAFSGNWYPEPVRAWVRPSVRYPFQALQTKTLSSQSNDLLKSIFWNDAESLHTRFLKILALCLIAGGAVAWTSIKFFGMDGLLSKWERDKYIPNSKIKEHRKHLNDLSPRKSNGVGALCLGVRADAKLHDPLDPKTLYLSSKKRELNPHMLVLGAGTKGKSRLIASSIIDDIRHEDRAVVVIDSDGALVDLILSWAAAQPDGKHLANRIQVIDPCKRESHLGYNPLLVNDPDAISSHAASIVMGFKAVYTETQNSQNQWTQQTANILRNALILLILNNRTISDLPLLLSDNDFRDMMLQQVERQHADDWKTLLEAWSNYKRLARSEQWINWIEPILNRVQPLLSEPRLSRLLNERQGAVDLDDVLAQKSILLVRVPEGQLHKGGNLLGSLIVTGLRQAAIQQYENEGSESNPCSIFVDELNNFFDAELFDAVSSETRKLQIGIIGTLRTLQDLSEDFRNRAVLSFGSMALFSIAKKDADILGPSMFRVDGRRVKKWNIRDWFNPVNSVPTTDLVSDEEKFNIDRLLGQPDRFYFAYLVGSQAGVFKMKAREFQDISKDKINWDLLDKMYELKQLSDDEAYESDEH